MTRPLALIAASVLVLSLAACTPSASAPPHDTGAPSPTAAPAESATPEPSESATPEPVGPPPIEELALTTEGLGTLVVGGPTPAAAEEQALIVYDPEFCTDFGMEPGSEFAGLWLPAEFYRTEEGPGFVRAPFGVRVQDDRLQRIEIEDESLTTDAGITLGSTVADVTEAYGDDVEVIPMGLTALHVVDGTAGKLVIEVATEDPLVPGYWEAGMLDTVVLLRAIPATEEPYSTAASGNVVNSCPE